MKVLRQESEEQYRFSYSCVKDNLVQKNNLDGSARGQSIPLLFVKVLNYSLKHMARDSVDL